MILSFDQFLRSVEISKNEEFGILLGAGASISSGVQSATDCIWEWKKNIYLSNNPNSPKWIENHKLDQVRSAIQKWLDNDSTYLPVNDSKEYEFYVEQCFPIEDDRRKYFQRICERKEPSVGYLMLCLLADSGLIHSVWTTNFDQLLVKAGAISNVTVIDISLDSVHRIHRPESDNELLHIALHGDYRYGSLKNTNDELKAQDQTFRDSLVYYLKSRHLIVIGYSGRDVSLMSALREAYSQPGSGRLYWCGYGDKIDSNVQQLLDAGHSSGRSVYFIPTDGFDKSMIRLGKTCLKPESPQYAKFHSLCQSAKSEFETTPFTLNFKYINNIIKSNCFPLQFPSEVFCFEISFEEGMGQWSQLKTLTTSKNIVAVPYKGIVWALGKLSDIQSCFEGRLVSKIARKPIGDIRLWKETSIYHLFLAALTRSLSAHSGLATNMKNLIWEDNVVRSAKYGEVIYGVHKAIRLFINFDKRYYLTLVPDFYVSSETDERVSKEVRQDIGRLYFEKLWNQKFNNYINDWRRILFPDNGGKVEIEFPLGSGTGFTFTIGKTPSFAKIMKAGAHSGISLNQQFPVRAIDYSGIQYDEPNLLFASKYKEMQPAKDYHPMRGLVNNKPFDYVLSGSILDNEVRLGIICPQLDQDLFSKFIARQYKSISTNGINKDYLIDFPGFISSFGLSINIPDSSDSRWLNCPEPSEFETLEESCRGLARILRERIDELTRNSKNLIVVIYIPERWNHLLSYESHGELFDLHDYIKAYCAEMKVTTQFIQEDTVRNSLECQIHWSLALSFYVKSFRTPWILDSLDPTTAFAGIGYSVDRQVALNHIVLGCSHIYNSHGEGLKYKLTKVEETPFWDRQKNPHLTYNDAFQFGLSIRELFFTSMNEVPKRVVVHKRTYFTRDEINGIRDSLVGNGVDNLDLVEINFEDSIKYVASVINSSGMPNEADSFSIRRGTCILQTDNTALLWSHGIVPSVRNPNYKFYLGGRYIPEPLKIVKHFGNGSMGQISNEILGLSKMNWNSFNLYSQLPATISSSNQIARIGKLLTKREGVAYDYRYFI